jgi:hypothetical protein
MLMAKEQPLQQCPMLTVARVWSMTPVQLPASALALHAMWQAPLLIGQRAVLRWRPVEMLMAKEQPLQQCPMLTVVRALLPIAGHLQVFV